MKSNDVNMSNETATTTKAVLDQNNIPIEELLGSVTTYNNVEGSDSKSQQLRTSARVFKKMKLDSAIATPVPAPLETPKKETLKDETKAETKTEAKTEAKSEPKSEPRTETKKLFRPTWSQEDKNMFFEALNEYGKDFEAIYSHITNKLRKKGLPDSVMKTKDQVRHFYYRTWHKISKHLKFSEDINKLAQELYGLINYGELRKKIGSVNEKMCMKLNELIYRGTVAFRLKGRTVRIKTPMCRALRKINLLDEKHDDLKLPTRVGVVLTPKDMTTWLTVQGISQNPRIKAALPLQKRLSTLIKFLHCKWKPVTTKAYEETLNSIHPLISDSVPDKKVIEEMKAIIEPSLRVTPSPKAQIELPTINLSEYYTNHSICLNALEERIGVKIPGEQLWLIKGNSKKGGTKRARNESNSEKLSPTTNKQTPLPATTTATTTITTDNNENCLNRNETPMDIDAIIDTVLALHNEEEEEKINNSTMKEIKKEEDEKIKDAEIKEQLIANIREGWTFQTSGNISIGELYLMFGSNSSLTLEYSWDQPAKLIPKVEPKSCDTETKPIDEKPNILNVTSDTTTNTKVNSNDPLHKDLNVEITLQKLLSIAKMQYRKNIVHCPCGHVCNGSKSNNVGKNKSTGTKANKSNATEKNSDVTEKSSVDGNTTSTGTVSVVPIIIQSPKPQYTPVTIFRRPVTPSNDTLRAQLDSIQRLTPRYCNRRGRRPRSKQVVVERRLPLLPNKLDSGRQIVQMNIISPEDMKPLTPRTIAPMIINIDKNEHDITNTINMLPTNGNLNTTQLTNFSLLATNSSVPPSCTLISSSIDLSDNAVTSSRVSSPTGLTNLLALGQNGHGLDNKDDTSIPSFVGLLSDTVTTPPTSPSRILKEDENQWLNSEVVDFSLSSFLGHLESPMKPSLSNLGTTSEDHNLSNDVDAQLQSLLMENSIDYTAQFADLAQVVSDIKK